MPNKKTKIPKLSTRFLEAKLPSDYPKELLGEAILSVEDRAVLGIMDTNIMTTQEVFEQLLGNKTKQAILHVLLPATTILGGISKRDVHEEIQSLGHNISYNSTSVALDMMNADGIVGYTKERKRHNKTLVHLNLPIVAKRLEVVKKWIVALDKQFEKYR